MSLMVEPRTGWTFRLLSRINSQGGHGHQRNRCLFSGPHGFSTPVKDCGVVLLLASGWGLMAQLPYLRRLIIGYNNYTTMTHRVHLVWQLDHIDDGASAKEFLDRALLEDTLDNVYIVAISIYYQKGHIDSSLRAPGNHRRVSFYEDRRPNWEEIIESELARKHNKVWTEKLLADGRSVPFEEHDCWTLVTVSTVTETRDQLRKQTWRFLNQRVRLRELAYQPPS
ncbi:hypothetical protein BJ878DRAFT_508971 [Calycina marina]|uniref:Ferric reductase NAD binding domain-containing protein n=1 Tax=Calycina marina TaxID=1763456 RepID=A0A9P7Z1T5_9HELO|nr:hypothetical protein BJ878DRAFT_508971 [Calycina marina]